MISVGNYKAVICKGDFHPAELYKGDKKIAGFAKTSFSTKGGVSLASCYNDRLHNAKITGNSVQNGTPTPETPIEIQSVGEFVSEGDYAGKYKIGVTARGKNLFEYTSDCSYVQSGSIVEKTSTGAVVRGNIKSGSSVNSWDRGWYTPGYLNGICPVLYNGDVVTISADVTLMELRQDSSYNIQVHLYARGAGGYADGTLTTIPLNKTIRIKRTYTLTNYLSGKTFYPCFVLNSNTVKIENIQIEYGSQQTPCETYIKPQTFDIYLDEPLRKIEGYGADYVDFENSIVRRYIKEKQFTGNESFYKNGESFDTVISDGAKSQWAEGINALCNSYINSKDYKNIHQGKATGKFIFGSAYFGSVAKFNVCDSNCKTADEFKGFLSEKYNSGNPVKLYYLLGTSQSTFVQLPKLPTFKGTTIYEIDTQITATISGNYKKTE